MAQNTPPTDHDGSDDQLTPADVRQDVQSVIEHLADHDSDQHPFGALLTPEVRNDVLYALLGATEPLAVSEIVDRTGRDQSVVNDHVQTLVEFGYVDQGKKGNARVYTARHEHPVIQVAQMLDTVQRHGVTPMLLDEQFIGEPGADYTPGDHPADARE